MAAEMSGKEKAPNNGDGARERREEFLRKRLPQGGMPGPSGQGEEQSEEKPEEKRRDAPERKPG